MVEVKTAEVFCSGCKTKFEIEFERKETLLCVLTCPVCGKDAKCKYIKINGKLENEEL